MDLFANPAVCCVAIELIKTACYYGSLSSIILYLLQEPTDTSSNVHDKRNSHFPIPELLLVGGSSACLCKVYSTCNVLTCLHWFFSLGVVTSREILQYIPAASDVFPRRSHDFQGNMLNTTSAVPLKVWLPMVQNHIDQQSNSRHNNKNLVRSTVDNYGKLV